ncbi:MAG: tetratricopeptide repeat protein [Chloroflexi bacterium]|nr:MAG: tetratricopeptide repeat protein [Chloroflexota bacterium]
MNGHSVTTIAAAALIGTIVAACGPSASGLANPVAPHTGLAVSLKTDDVVARNQARIRQHADDWKSIDDLAAAYLQKVREVGDPSYYGKVEALLKRALAHDPGDAQASTSMGLLALARHEFVSALTWGDRAAQLDPAGARPLGIIGDAQIELGRYADAVQTFQAMVDRRPDLGSYARVSYARELFGDVDGAISAMQQAVEAGGTVPENGAYTRVLLANLYFNGGRLADAEAAYRRALFDQPRYPYALAGLARLEAARGRYAAAIDRYRAAVDVYPLPDFVIGLGDAYAAAGDSGRAAQTYDLAVAEQQLYRANGVDLDAELALFDADHRRDLPAALAAARRAMADRPSVRSADILAWTLYQAGEDAAALTASDQAIRLGTRDAGMYFHRGMIEARLGQTSTARTDLQTALRINPYFSVIWSPVARQTLASVRGGGQGGGV